MNTATYSPEDNKLRLYVGRVPRDEYEKLRAEGWTSTPKQSCDFVATWSPRRRDTCLEYAEIIEDEDMGPAERAADRAERFAGYREKRTEEAAGHADRYDAGPSAHGFQNAARAERSAARHDRIASHAVDAWSKAEYWQRRTAGVISHALYISTPAVRMGRIKTLEAEQRKHLSNLEQVIKRFKAWKAIEAIDDKEAQTAAATRLSDYDSSWLEYVHPVTGQKASLYSLMRDPQHPLTGAQACGLVLDNWREPTMEDDWSRHYELRLAYENQMLESQGGRAAFVEMVAGGWVGSWQVRRVNKSPATGRVVSVQVLAPAKYSDDGKAPVLRVINIERMGTNIYRPPTEDDMKALAATLKAEKAAKPASAPCPLINPTDEEAQRLQDILNARRRVESEEHRKKNGWTNDFVPSEVNRMTQAEYSARSKGSYAIYETRGLCRGGIVEPRASNMWTSRSEAEAKARGPAICQIRRSSGQNYMADRVIVLTDKPRKAFPVAVWETVLETVEA